MDNNFCFVLQSVCGTFKTGTGTAAPNRVYSTARKTGTPPGSSHQRGSSRREVLPCTVPPVWLVPDLLFNLDSGISHIPPVANRAVQSFCSI